MMSRMTEVEREFMGGKRSKIWTYLILFGVLIVGVLIANFALSNPELARNGVDKFLGLPGWAFPIIIGFVGAVVYWLGLKVETDWPEALGAFLIAGAVAAGEIMIGWNKFQLGGLTVLPYIIPAAVFLVLLGFGMTRSR